MVTINRVPVAVVLVVLATVAAVAAGAQEQGGQQQSGMRDYLFNTLSGLVRQYQDGQEDQAQSGMRDLLVGLVGDIASRQRDWPDQQQDWPDRQQDWPDQQQNMNSLFGDVVNDVARQYGGSDVTDLFGDVAGDVFSQFDPTSQYYQNLTDIYQRSYEPRPNSQPWSQLAQPGGGQPGGPVGLGGGQFGGGQLGGRSAGGGQPRGQYFSSCMIVGERVLLTNTGAVFSQDRGTPVGQLIQSANPRCRYMIRDFAGREYCVATSGYVWSQPYQQPVGQCASR